MQGFNAPGILFLNTWDKPERDYCLAAMRCFREKGYTQYVEPACGAFAMATVAQAAGYRPEEIIGSDVSLFSALLGCCVMERDPAELSILLNGEPFPFDSKRILDRAAEVMYQQLYIRTSTRPDRDYWHELLTDLVDNRECHTKRILGYLTTLHERLAGMSYRSECMFRHIEEVRDNPDVLIFINPPTYKGGFEKFFDTGNQLTWREPQYEIFDAKTGIRQIMEMMSGRKALIICTQQTEPGKADGEPIYARHLSPGQYVYLLSNRPKEVTEAIGLQVVPLTKPPIEPLSCPTIAPNEDLETNGSVALLPVSEGQANYYRDLWLHKITWKPGGCQNIAVLLSGRLMGMIGYDPRTVMLPYGERLKHELLLTYAVGAPHKDRLTRLITMLALDSSVIERVLPPPVATRVQSVITKEFTPYPEAKGLRGLMKLVRKSSVGGAYQPTYQADCTRLPTQTILTDWYRKEKQWQKSRKQQK